MLQKKLELFKNIIDKNLEENSFQRTFESNFSSNIPNFYFEVRKKLELLKNFVNENFENDEFKLDIFEYINEYLEKNKNSMLFYIEFKLDEYKKELIKSIKKQMEA